MEPHGEARGFNGKLSRKLDGAAILRRLRGQIHAAHNTPQRLSLHSALALCSKLGTWPARARAHVRSWPGVSWWRTLLAFSGLSSQVKSYSPGEHEGSAQHKPQGPAWWGRVVGMRAAAPAALWAA